VTVIFYRGSLVEAHINEAPPPIRLAVEDSYTGKSFQCLCVQGRRVVPAQWTLESGSQYATLNENGRCDILPGAAGGQIAVSCSCYGQTLSKTVSVTYYDNQLEIACEPLMIGEAGNVVALYNGETVPAAWSITDGQSCATIDALGELSIASSGDVTVQATYNGYSATRRIEVVYQANTTTQTTVDDDGTVTTETVTVTENPDGSTTTSSTATAIGEDGYMSQTSSTTVEREDGSSATTSETTNSDGTRSETASTTSAPDQSGTTTTTSETTHYDSGGNESGTSETTRHDYGDGSSDSTTTNYDASGDPASQVNEETDTDGNASTQNISYDSSGDPVVTGYAIDTSGSQEGQKELDMDGVNTEFYGFDSTTGFTMDLHFTIDFTDQPPGQDENHHNVLSMKRASPQPWYGLQIRQTSTNKYV